MKLALGVILFMCFVSVCGIVWALIEERSSPLFYKIFILLVALVLVAGVFAMAMYWTKLL